MLRNGDDFAVRNKILEMTTQLNKRKQKQGDVSMKGEKKENKKRNMQILVKIK